MADGDDDDNNLLLGLLTGAIVAPVAPPVDREIAVYCSCYLLLLLFFRSSTYTCSGCRFCYYCLLHHVHLKLQPCVYMEINAFICILDILVGIMGQYRHNMLLNIIGISISISLALMPYLSSSSYFYNQYATAASARSSSLELHKFGIQICCSWGNEIEDGILTYRIDNDADAQVVQAVHQAVDEWNSKISNIKLQEVSDSDADIDIKTNSKASKVTRSSVIGESKISAGKNIKLVAPGESQISFDSRGSITHVDITISTKARGNSFGSSQLESIAKHEIGHAYGIGHTNFIGDLMSPVLTYSSTDISQCDINGIEEANGSPHSRQFLRC